MRVKKLIKTILAIPLGKIDHIKFMPTIFQQRVLHREVVPAHLLQQLGCYLGRFAVRTRSKFRWEPLKFLGCELSCLIGRRNCSFGTNPFVI